MIFLQTDPKVSRRRVGRQLFALGVLTASLLSAANASAQTQTTLGNLNNSNGANPYAGLLVDANGNLFGTTSSGGSGFGTVFKLALTPTGYASTPTTLVSFNYINGAGPLATLIADANGNLFGTTHLGGLFGAGTVFELVRTATGYATAPTTLVNFHNNTGAYPYAGLIADANGNLFGTTSSSASGYGTVLNSPRR